MMYEKLKEKRLSYGYTCQQMADMLNISKVFYYQIEAGKRNLSYDNAVRISRIFNEKPDTIFYRDHLKKTK